MPNFLINCVVKNSTHHGNSIRNARFMIKQQRRLLRKAMDGEKSVNKNVKGALNSSSIVKQTLKEEFRVDEIIMNGVNLV